MTADSKDLNAIARLARGAYEQHPALLKFRETAVLHDYFSHPMTQLAERIQYGEQQSITAVIGPTGSGKTTMCREFCYQFSRANRDIPANARKTLLYMELAAPEQGAFKWKDDLYLPALIALREPCIHQKIDIPDLRRRLGAGGLKDLGFTGRERIVDFRRDLFQALDRAKACAALFDEAQHMRRPTTKNGIFHQYDALKSRSNETSTHFCLIGALELKDILFQSGQISKRVQPLWMSPYRIDKSTELRAFRIAANGLFQKLQSLEEFKLELAFDVAIRFPYMAQRSVGLFGLLSDWAERALIRAIVEDKHKITWNDMLQNQIGDVQLLGIMDDVIRFFAVRDDLHKSLAQRKSFLFGLPSASPAAAPPAAADRPQGVGPKTKPGERKPARDKVGHE